MGAVVHHRQPLVRRATRRGVASVLAMLYLVIFSTLALGFYSATTLATQIAANNRRTMEAQVAAESGLQFVRYQLSRVKVDASVPTNKVFEEVYHQLANNLNGKPNLGGAEVGYDGTSIAIPGGGTYIDVTPDGGTGFAALIIPDGERLVTKLVGRSGRGAARRAVQLDFEHVNQSTSIFDYGIVARGPIVMSGGGLISNGTNRADSNVLSLAQTATPVTMSGSAAIAGDLFMTNPKGALSASGSASVGGSSIASQRDLHVHAGSPNPEPELPQVDTGIFLPYVTNTYHPGQHTYTNCLIPAGTNPNFGGQTTIDGVLYIKSPNKDQ